MKRANKNLSIVENFVDKHDWIEFYTKNKDTRSNTSVCLKINSEKDKIKKMEKYLADNKIALDINS